MYVPTGTYLSHKLEKDYYFLLFEKLLHYFDDFIVKKVNYDKFIFLMICKFLLKLVALYFVNKEFKRLRGKIIIFYYSEEIVCINYYMI